MFYRQNQLSPVIKGPTFWTKETGGLLGEFQFIFLFNVQTLMDMETPESSKSNLDDSVADYLSRCGNVLSSQLRDRKECPGLAYASVKQLPTYAHHQN